MTKNFASLASASVLAFGLGLPALPNTAHAGFLEQLFGIAPQAAAPVAPAPDYRYDAPQSFDAPVRRRAKRKVALDDKPKLQKPTDLMHDTTLQTGDAVMMKGGIHVYVGDDRDMKHSKADFEPIDEVRGLPRQERRALIAKESFRGDTVSDGGKKDVVSSGRSAAVADVVARGHDIIDARGKTVRYVGP